MKYLELNLEPALQGAIEKLGYEEATAIQEQTIPHILLGKDVAGLAQTGTGKTAAFLIPLIDRILKTTAKDTAKNTGERIIPNWNARSFVLILVPTRELAEQINDNVLKLTLGTDLKSFPLYGGTGYEKQKEALSKGLQFVVSTPGRLIDMYKENHIDLKQVSAVVFDEADRMFDMGFKDDMKYILSRIPKERQFLVFSATLNFDVLNTAYQFGAEPVEINISRDQAKAENVKDCIIHLGHEDKPQHLLSILKKENPKQAMIFTNFKHNVDRLAAFLMSNKIPAMGISSLMSQSHRNQVIEKFKADNDQNILVATDVAARGLDINGVDLVINFEMPQDAESYVHRIGRTGRAGREGKAYSLICDRDIDSLSRVEDYTKKKIEAVFLEDTELVKEFKSFGSEESASKKKFDKPRREREHFDKKSRFKNQDRNDFKNDRKDSDTTKTGKPFDKSFKSKEGRPQRKPTDNKFQAKDKQNSGYVAKTQAPREDRPVAKNLNSSRNFRSNSKATDSAKKVSLTGRVKKFIQKIFG